MYNKSTWSTQNGKYQIIKKYYSCRVLPCGQTGKAVREQRTARENETSEKQKEINRRIRQEKLMRLLLDNFSMGDWYLTCTFDVLPESRDEIKKIWAGFKRKVKALYRKADVPFQYVAIIEHLSGKGRPHGHILMKQLPSALMGDLLDMWKWGNLKIQKYGGRLEDAERLSAYFTKESVESTSSPLQTSRNLVRTEPKKKIISRANTFSEDMKPPKGYRLVEKFSYSGYTSEGFPLIKMFCERIDGNGSAELPEKDAGAAFG